MKSIKEFIKGLQLSSILISFFASAFLAFGMYNVHSVSGVTEGGVLGLNLLIEHHFGISQSITNLILNIICYVIGWRILGKRFIAYSFVSSVGFSIAYRICEQFPRLFPSIADMPLLASVIGAVFVGIGAGLCVRVGGATSGDDALAMAISHKFRIKIEHVYLISDLTVLLLSLTYIPITRILYSLLTVFLSGRLIGLIQRMPCKYLPKEDDT
jgi:uncharacterized membrane-anchored protein YitT (DUF2179 family)